MRYTKKPVTIEAIQLPTAPDHAAVAAVVDFIGDDDARPVGGGRFEISTLEGLMTADPGDWIIRGIKGELYPCKPDIFAASYGPADQAEGAGKNASYRGDGMDFGQALDAMKEGSRVARAGWNGKGMWIAIQAGSTINAENARGGAAAGRAAEGANVIDILPHVDMRAADGSIVVGWLASQTDMLASDWTVVE